MLQEKPYLNLLDESFPGIKANILRCEKLGYPWISRPFQKLEKGKALAHVGLLDIPLYVNGSSYPTVALHAICTQASHRSQGLAMQLILEALQYAKERYECVILFTEIPKLYEKLLFRYVQEYRFHMSCRQPKGAQTLRSVISPADDPLFLRLFCDRDPVSRNLWIEDKGLIGSFNALFSTYPIYWSLYYSAAFDGFISYQLRDKTLHLFDIVAKKLPSLDLILDHLPAEIEEIYFYFSPDRFTDDVISEPFLYDNGYLMVYGNWPQEKPFMIPPLARC